ncbi:TIGR03086 family metal-binding protein [Streptacidiphilus sp. EB129]|uniref:TIGR03086 family metal-binding protein n=1 Tax=Streptacidiphilus sp. EB129 TaxID=3156262 RepID=UPI003518CEE6
MSTGTPTELSDQLARAASALLAHAQQPALDGKREFPTPCTKFTVHELSEHLLGVLTMSSCAAAKEALPADAPMTLTQPPWDAYPPLVERLTAAWSRPEAWEGETPFGPGTFPAMLAGMITMLELTVHGWDLATATGQPFRTDPDIVATAAAVAAQIAPDARSAGAFGPEVVVPADAPALDRLIAFTGRTPVTPGTADATVA